MSLIHEKYLEWYLTLLVSAQCVSCCCFSFLASAHNYIPYLNFLYGSKCLGLNFWLTSFSWQVAFLLK